MARGHVADFVEKQRALVGQLEFSGLAPGRAGKRALLVSEQFAFEQIFRNRRAVDFDEGAGGALRMLVNGAGDQIFSDAAFAAEQHGGVGRRHALDQREHGLHFVALRDDVVVGVAVAQRFAQRAIFLAQAVRIEFLANHQDEFGERKRLGDEVARADFHRFDGRFDRAVGRHHHHGQRGVHALHGLQKFQAAHSRQAQVGHHEVGLFADQKLQTGFRVRRRVDDESLLRQAAARAAASSWLRLRRRGWWLFSHISGSKTAINLRLESVAVLCFE